MDKVEFLEYVKEHEQVNKKGSQRDEVVGLIFSIYTNQTQRNLRKKENWKRYISFLKENKCKDATELREQFKKTKKFIKEMPISQFCYFISHIPTDDLYHSLSIARDMDNRSQSFGSYFIGTIAGKGYPQNVS